MIAALSVPEEVEARVAPAPPAERAAAGSVVEAAVAALVVEAERAVEAATIRLLALGSERRGVEEPVGWIDGLGDRRHRI